MPHSDERLRPWILDELWRQTDGGRDPDFFRSIVDVGAGAGTWLDFLRPHMPDARFTAIEVWEPYLTAYSLRERYDEVILGDAREVALPAADLYIFGDVLEHMPAPDAVRLWDRAREVASWLVINLPVRRYEQGALHGNPHEVHVHHWDTASVLESFGGIAAHHEGFPETGSVVGAFIARGAA